MTTPSIILIRPQMGENIGAVARAMMNFGLRDLRIVNPRDGWPNAAAEAMAAHGVEIIQNATIYDSTEAALADLHTVYATTARDRRQNKPVLDVRQAAAEMRAKITPEHKVGILFGPERSGLENEEITLSDAILTVPVDPACASLNLAQCAVLVGYEWWVTQDDLPAPPTAPIESATHGEMQQFFTHLEQMLDAVDYFHPIEKKEKMWQTLRNMFLKANHSPQEIQTLHGVLKSVEHKLK